MTPETLLQPLAVFLAAYGALSGFTWLRRVVAERPARRRGMGLNLARRAGPPVLAGVAVLAFGALSGAAGTGLPAALLIAGGLAFGLHEGLAETGLGSWRSEGLRLLLSLAAMTGALWLAGLAV
jgi:hypothetical protein